MVDASEETKQVFTIAEHGDTICDKLTQYAEDTPSRSDDNNKYLDEPTGQNHSVTSFKNRRLLN